MSVRALALVATLMGTASCAVVRQIAAPADDLADYRAFRVAAHEGTRLARAQRYLEAHPEGTWSKEVRAAFETEEPAFFDAATITRDRTREYLADLPNGPHAAAAVSLLTAYDRRVEDETTARMMREARRTEAMLEQANAQRRAVGETLFAWLAALLDPDVYDARINEAPPALRRALAGEGRPTWGALPMRRDADLFFILPTRPERESRLLALSLVLRMRDDRIIEGRIEGPDLFVRWMEADEIRPLDPTRDADRAAAAFHAKELLSGALEARFPVQRCDATDPRDPTLLARACDDWVATVRMAEAGKADSVTIRGPGGRKTGRAPVLLAPEPSRARPTSDRESGRRSAK